MIIGICGGSGSGKTTLLKRIAREYREMNPTLFTMDNYYRPIQDQQKDIYGEVNFDLPTALHRDKLVNDLCSLKEGRSIEVKEYFFNAPPDKNVLLTLNPSDLVIVEGLFLFAYEELHNLVDYSIFMEVDMAVQLDRRIYRDQETRGYSREEILHQWNNHVIPCYDNYLAPYKKYADFSFRNNEQFDEEFSRLKNVLEEKLK
jgi:uridine kinase